MDKKQTSFDKYVSPLTAWALVLGTGIGWGSLVVTSNNYLSHAGPLGSALGILIGAVIMIAVARNYAYLIGRFPSAGGAYTYAKKVFGYDQGFLTAWFLALTYISMFWANATSLPLFARYFLGDIFRFGYIYSIFGYDIYIGEVMLTIAAVMIFSLLCMNFKKLLAWTVSAMAIFLTLCISICFVVAIIKHGGASYSFHPLFTENGSALSQVVRIACISPWAFIGFENISHSSEEFTFSEKKTLKILILAVLTLTALYVFITLLSVTAYPDRYDSWFEYIRDIDNLSGIEGLPVFYAAHYYMGDAGVWMLILTLLALIITSLIGNLTALSRLNYALAKDDILPKAFAALNSKSIPWKAVLLVGGISVFVPFLGRTTIGCIVDVTTIGATIIYGFVSAAAIKMAKKTNDRSVICTGIVGLVMMIAFGLYLLIPELFTDGSIAKETYFLFTTWAILGFIFFRYILKKDYEQRFGRSIVVWIAVLSLILFTSLVWLSKSTMSMTNEAMESVKTYYDSLIDTASLKASMDTYMNQKMLELRNANFRSILMVTVFFAISIFVLLNNYTLMKTRMLKGEQELLRVKNIANADPLTGVKSKHAFAESERLINEEIRAGLINEFAVVICDVNGLKHINDTLGHKAGDEYIRSASNIICKHFANSPVYRIGGDEFAVILTGNDYLKRHEKVDDINRIVEDAIETGDVVFSIGISDYVPRKDDNIYTVLERADALMYNRKKQLKQMGAVTR